jgi:hypothetical protein
VVAVINAPSNLAVFDICDGDAGDLELREPDGDLLIELLLQSGTGGCGRGILRTDGSGIAECGTGESEKALESPFTVTFIVVLEIGRMAGGVG